ncbi:hypothetical protein HGRIS_000753 [Hohenbuehelia grisea]|uniref:NACHT domain-containing protein n=1 Tax=Hohenbuehelia grisea TaxID=104357 RepID=A0ABR3IPM3_9AGAR
MALPRTLSQFTSQFRKPFKGPHSTSDNDVRQRLPNEYSSDQAGAPTPTQESQLNHHICGVTCFHNTGSGKMIINTGSGTITHVEGDLYQSINHNTYQASKDYENGLILKQLERAKRARFSSVRDVPATELRFCLDGTRTELLTDIRGWMTQNTGLGQVFWLKGSVGTGKTTVASTVARLAHDYRSLGGDFFFSRFDTTLSDRSLVFPTIAFHLSYYNPDFKLAIAAAVSETAEFESLQPQYQFNALVPHVKALFAASTKPVVFVFDGIDECENGVIGANRDVIQFLVNIAQLSSNVRIFLTSRPEPYIGQLLQSLPGLDVTIRSLDAEKAFEGDITTYIRHELVRITANLGIATWYTEQWFTDKDVKDLADRAGRSFAYAATVIRFIGDPQINHPRSQLDIVLSDILQNESVLLSNLDLLYILVLHRAFPEGTSARRIDILHSATAVMIERAFSPIVHIAWVTEYTEIDLLSVFHNLASIFYMGGPKHCMILCHDRSFVDFITDDKRCPKLFHVDMKKHRMRIARRIFRAVGECWSRHRPIEATVVSWDAAESLCPHNDTSCDYALQSWTDHVSKTDPSDAHWSTVLPAFFKSDKAVYWLSRLFLTDLEKYAISYINFLILWNVGHNFVTVIRF